MVGGWVFGRGGFPENQSDGWVREFSWDRLLLALDAREFETVQGRFGSWETWAGADQEPK